MQNDPSKFPSGCYWRGWGHLSLVVEFIYCNVSTKLRQTEQVRWVRYTLKSFGI